MAGSSVNYNRQLVCWRANTGVYNLGIVSGMHQTSPLVEGRVGLNG
jgi:hypothetical protein